MSNLSETPRATVDPRVATLNRDVTVPINPDRTAVFGDDAPETDAEWHRMVFPKKYARVEGEPVYYRIPGVAFGVCVGRLGKRAVLLVTWPKRNYHVSVSDEHLELIREEDTVDGIKVPRGFVRPEGFREYLSLPHAVRVRFLCGRQTDLGLVPGGIQQNINLCFARHCR